MEFDVHTLIYIMFTQHDSTILHNMIDQWQGILILYWYL